MDTAERILAEIPPGGILYLDLFRRPALADMTLVTFLDGMRTAVERGWIELEREPGKARRVIPMGAE